MLSALSFHAGKGAKVARTDDAAKCCKGDGTSGRRLNKRNHNRVGGCRVSTSYSHGSCSNSQHLRACRRGFRCRGWHPHGEAGRSSSRDRSADFGRERQVRTSCKVLGVTCCRHCFFAMGITVKRRKAAIWKAWRGLMGVCEPFGPGVDTQFQGFSSLPVRHIGRRELPANFVSPPALY